MSDRSDAAPSHSSLVTRHPSLGLRQLAGAAGIVMGGVVLSRLLGLVRNAVLGAYFADSADYEAYVAAIAVPDTVFQVLAGGLMGAAFIPVFTRGLAAADRDAVWRLTSSAINAAALLTVTLALLLAVFAQPVMGVLAAGRDPAFQALAADLVRVMLVSPVIFAVSGFATSVLNSFQRFFWPALAPLLYNLGIIGGAVLGHEHWGIHGVAYGVVAGAALHLLIQVPDLVHVGMRYRPVLDWRDASVREVARLTVPRMVGLSVVQVSQLLTIMLASFLTVGSIAYLNYAWLVLMVPLGLFGMAVSTAVFPTLARHGADARHAELRQLFALSLRMILFLTVPATVGLAALAEPIVRVLLERDRFTPEVTAAVALALACYAWGLAGHSAVEIINRAFYALHDTLTPVKAAGVALLVYLGLSATVVLLARGEVIAAERAYAGLALGNAVAALVEAFLLVWWLRRLLGALDFRDLARAVLQFAAAAVFMGSAVRLLQPPLEGLSRFAGALGPLVALGALISIGVLAYLAACLVLGCREPRLLLGLWRRRAPGRATTEP